MFVAEGRFPIDDGLLVLAILVVVFIVLVVACVGLLQGLCGADRIRIEEVVALPEQEQSLVERDDGIIVIIGSFDLVEQAIRYALLLALQADLGDEHVVLFILDLDVAVVAEDISVRDVRDGVDGLAGRREACVDLVHRVVIHEEVLACEDAGEGDKLFAVIDLLRRLVDRVEKDLLNVLGKVNLEQLGLLGKLRFQLRLFVFHDFVVVVCHVPCLSQSYPVPRLIPYPNMERRECESFILGVDVKKEMSRRRVIGNQLIADDCLVCGMENHIGLHAQFMDLEDGCVYAKFTPRFELQSYPDRVHGGITSSLMDELLSRAIQNGRPRQLSVTIELSLKYRAALSLDKPVRAIAWMERERSRVYDAAGQIVLEDGTVAVEAWGRYLKADMDELGGEEGREYFFEDTRPCPEYVVI